MLVYEQQYKEAVAAGDTLGAVALLRTHIGSLCSDMDHVRELSAMLMRSQLSFPPPTQARTALIDAVSAFLPPSIATPPHRLETLLLQV